MFIKSLLCTILSQEKFWAKVFVFPFLTKGKRTVRVLPCVFCGVGGATVSLGITGRGLQSGSLTGLPSAWPGSCLQGYVLQKEGQNKSYLQ